MTNPFEVIEARLSNIETLLLDIKHNPKEQANSDRWFNLDELCNYLPDKPAKQTIYGYVSAGLIPVHKHQGSKKLRFLKSEIDAWLKSGRKKTIAEIESESDDYLINKRSVKK